MLLSFRSPAATAAAFRLPHKFSFHQVLKQNDKHCQNQPFLERFFVIHCVRVCVCVCAHESIESCICSEFLSLCVCSANGRVNWSSVGVLERIVEWALEKCGMWYRYVWPDAGLSTLEFLHFFWYSSLARDRRSGLASLNGTSTWLWFLWYFIIKNNKSTNSIWRAKLRIFLITNLDIYSFFSASVKICTALLELIVCCSSNNKILKNCFSISAFNPHRSTQHRTSRHPHFWSSYSHRKRPCKI